MKTMVENPKTKQLERQLNDEEEKLSKEELALADAIQETLAESKLGQVSNAAAYHLAKTLVAQGYSR